MKLITELHEDLDFFEEEADGKKNLFIEGTFLQSETVNRNKRSYPRHILEKEVRRYNKEYVKENRAFGELGHPDGPTINLDRVSHMITNIRRTGNDWIGKAKVLTTTPSGKIVEGLLKEGAKLGVSSRGMGTLKDQADGTKLVSDDFHLATAADIVADPSAPNAFVQGIMEGREWIWENGILRETDLEELKEQLDVSKKEREEKALLAFQKFINNVKF